MRALRILSRLPAPPVVSIVVGATFTAAIIPLNLGLNAILHRGFPAVFILPVVLSAWLGGTASGIVASVLSAAAIDYFVQEPRFDFAVSSPADAIQLVAFVLVGLAISYLVRTRRQTREALQEHAEALEVMRERERIAMDLHDGIIQSLYAATLKVASIRRQLTPDDQAARGALEGANQTILAEIESVRAYIAGLRRGTDKRVDLSAVLDALAKQAAAGCSLRVRVQTDPAAADAVRLAQAHDLLYVAREALSNAIRHAHAEEVGVSLALIRRSVVLKVWDDGSGFNPELVVAPGDGLANISQRASNLNGRLAIRSRPGKGTTVALRLPPRDSALTHAASA